MPPGQDAAEGQGLPDSVPFLDVALDDPQRPPRESLQPQDTSLEIARRYPHLEPDADDLLLRQDRELGERAVDMMACLSLVAEVMVSRGKETIRHHQIDCIARICREAGEAPSEFERGAKVTIVELVDAQAPEGAEPVSPIVEPFRKRERGCPSGTGLSGAADAVHQRPAKRCGKPHPRRAAPAG